MKSRLQMLRSKSFETGFIWKTSAAIIVLGAAIALGMSFLLADRDDSDWRSDTMLSDKGKLNTGGLGTLRGLEEGDFEVLIGEASFLSFYYRGEEVAKLQKRVSDRFGARRGELFIDYLSALEDSSSEGAARLRRDAEATPLERYANRLMGEVALRSGDRLLAFTHFVQEGTLPEAEVAREKAVRLLVEAESVAQLAELLKDPLYREYLTPQNRLLVARGQRDWVQVALVIPEYLLSAMDSRYLVLALLGAIVWGVILARLGQMEWGLNRLSALCVAGFFAGVLSVWPTLFLVYFESEYVGYTPDGDMMRTMAFFIGGVGFREEVCKLALFIPLIPFLMRRRIELDALLVASFVGLGFAAEENISYFASTMGTAAPSRLLTANFFHIALTGVSGLALTRMVAGGSFSEFLYRFGIVVVAHGLYNALLSIQALNDGGFLALIVFILISMYYFREYEVQRYGEKGGFSLTSLLAFGLCGLISLALIFLTLEIGLANAFSVIISEFLGVAIIIVMFTREFNEPLR